MVHPQRRPRPTRCEPARARPRAALVPRLHARTATRTGSNGLNGDWLISRQRFFGVPFPVWYPLDDDGDADRTPADPARRGRAADRPVDRRARRLRRRPARPAGRLHRRPRRDGHVGDVVADAADRRAAGTTTPTCSRASSRWTCARRPTTSSAPGCSPRSCARTSSTTSLPWRDAAISGCDPRPRPQEDVEVEGQRRDAARPARRRTAPTRCGTGRRTAGPGTDTAFDEDQMKVGRQLAIKLLNVSKFVLGLAGDRRRRADADASPSRSTGRCSPGSPTSSTRRPTAFEAYDYARALERTEAFFWCVLRRLRRAGEGPGLRRRRRRGAASATRRARASRSSTLLRLFAPILPVRRPKRCGRGGRTGRCTERRGPTPTTFAPPPATATPSSPTSPGDVLGAVRKAKSEAQKSMRDPSTVSSSATHADRIDALRFALDDLKEAGSISNVDLELLEATRSAPPEIERRPLTAPTRRPPRKTAGPAAAEAERPLRRRTALRSRGRPSGGRACGRCTSHWLPGFVRAVTLIVM